MTLSLIFPMAGQGARFGYRFKPFLNFRGNAFIQAAFQPFRPFLGEIARVYFVFLREQENAHLVSQRLSSMFADVDHRVVILPAPTAGPAETLFQCLTRARIEGKIMVCDCDHALDVGGLMRLAVSDPLAACGLPTWDLTGEPLCSWSVAAIDADDRVTAIAEKQMPEAGGACRGVIGCYYFADADRARRIVDGDKQLYISDLVRTLIRERLLVRSVAVKNATFFGDPARLERAIRSDA
jgi:GTP:adenosylcobinamide-phosphate guanylyltransferase